MQQPIASSLANEIANSITMSERSGTRSVKVNSKSESDPRRKRRGIYEGLWVKR